MNQYNKTLQQNQVKNKKFITVQLMSKHQTIEKMESNLIDSQLEFNNNEYTWIELKRKYTSSPTTLRLISFLVTNFNKNKFCFPSRNFLAQKMGCSITTISRITTILQQDGLLQKRQSGYNQSNIYVLNSKLKRSKLSYDIWFDNLTRQQKEVYIQTQDIVVANGNNIIQNSIQREYVTLDLNNINIINTPVTVIDKKYNITLDYNTRARDEYSFGTENGILKNRSRKESKMQDLIRDRLIKAITGNSLKSEMKEFIAKPQINQLIFTPLVEEISKFLELDRREKCKLACYPYSVISEIKKTVFKGMYCGTLFKKCNDYAQRNGIKIDFKLYFSLCEIYGVSPNFKKYTKPLEKFGAPVSQAMTPNDDTRMSDNVYYVSDRINLTKDKRVLTPNSNITNQKPTQQELQQKADEIVGEIAFFEEKLKTSASLSYFIDPQVIIFNLNNRLQETLNEMELLDHSVEIKEDHRESNNNTKSFDVSCKTLQDTMATINIDNEEEIQTAGKNSHLQIEEVDLKQTAIGHDYTPVIQYAKEYYELIKKHATTEQLIEFMKKSYVEVGVLHEDNALYYVHCQRRKLGIEYEQRYIDKIGVHQDAKA